MKIPGYYWQFLTTKTTRCVSPDSTRIVMNEPVLPWIFMRPQADGIVVWICQERPEICQECFFLNFLSFVAFGPILIPNTP